MKQLYPAFQDLPLQRPGPVGNAWTLWGPEDELGTLNHLTADVVQQAAKEEIITGERVSLNWHLEGAEYPRFQNPRQQLVVKLIDKEPRIAVFDDEWTFNTQCSSQWDGCRHFAWQGGEWRGLFYKGRKGADFKNDKSLGGVQHMSKKGIAGRALLVDWYRWKTRAARGSDAVRESDIDAFSQYKISWSELNEAARWQGTPLKDCRPGDILVVRSGYLRQYETMEETRRAELDTLYQTTKPSNIGLQASRELLEFLWEKRIAAVAGDSRSFEAWPCEGADKQWQLHQWLLAGWGMPIGELFELEALSELCATIGRWRFFLTSSPMNVKGGVASPPNALAFF